MKVRLGYVNEKYPCHRCMHEGSDKCRECGTVVTPSGRIQKPTMYEELYGRKIYDTDKLPKTVVKVICAVIADTRRRQKALDLNTARPESRDLFVAINNAVDKAMADLEPGLRNIMINDFETGCGYQKSDAMCIIGKNAYYRRKRKVVADVARGLYLI